MKKSSTKVTMAFVTASVVMSIVYLWSGEEHRAIYMIVCAVFLMQLKSFATRMDTRVPIGRRVIVTEHDTKFYNLSGVIEKKLPGYTGKNAYMIKFDNGEVWTLPEAYVKFID